MYGIFMESLVIFKLYTGLRFLIVLFALSWIYLLFAEKDKKRRLLFVAAPPLILLAFLFPVSRKIFVAAGLDGQTYYRILWTVPMGLITAYGMCRAFEAHRRIGLVICALLVILCGSFVYKSGYIQKAENPYHIPDTVIRICDLIAPGEEEGHVMVVVPEELVYFVRQYNARIRMPYGREMIEGQWDYYNEVHEAMEETEIIDLEKLLEATRKEYCQYIVINPTRKVKGDAKELGLQLLADIEGYRIYRDPVAAAEVESWQQYYEEDQD
ncbi:MAG: hypothetical protein K2P13_06865 [Lachnospiraceae bacterium]|nr:hypothetical protein [Lachnospiraceae bacterium]